MTPMDTYYIERWLAYWEASSTGPAIDKVKAFDQVHQCRKFNAVMRTGRFANVSDLQIWRALSVMRENRKAVQRAIETA